MAGLSREVIIMKMQEAIDIMNDKPKGFMVHFEWRDGKFLRGDYFPDKHAGEQLIESEDEAWRMAEKFAKKMQGKIVNVYVVNSMFCPISNYRERMIMNR